MTWKAEIRGSSELILHLVGSDHHISQNCCCIISQMKKTKHAHRRVVQSCTININVRTKSRSADRFLQIISERPQGAVVGPLWIHRGSLLCCFLSFTCTGIKTQSREALTEHTDSFTAPLTQCRWREKKRQGVKSSDWNQSGASSSSSLRLLVLLADALLPGVFALVLPVAVRRVEDPAGQRDGLGGQLLLRDAALPQVGFGRHSWGLRPAVRDVVRAVDGSVVVRRRPVGMAVQPRVGVSMRVWVVVRVRGGAAVMEGAHRVHRVDLWSAVVDVQVGGGQVLVRWGPQVAGKRLQGVVPDGARVWILTSVVTLTQGGHAAAGAAWQGRVTAP